MSSTEQIKLRDGRNIILTLEGRAFTHIIENSRPNRVVVYLALALFAARGIHNPAMSDIARTAGISVPTAREALRNLEELGWLAIDEQADASGVLRAPHLYTLTAPSTRDVEELRGGGKNFSTPPKNSFYNTTTTIRDKSGGEQSVVPEPDAPPPLAALWIENIHGNLGPMDQEKLALFEELYGYDAVRDAIGEASATKGDHKRAIGVHYLRGILERWKREGRTGAKSGPSLYDAHMEVKR